MNSVHHGMNRRDLDRILMSLGGIVRHLDRTGEVQYTHPLLKSRPRANGRRKDAGRHLTCFVRELQRHIGRVCHSVKPAA